MAYAAFGHGPPQRRRRRGFRGRDRAGSRPGSAGAAAGQVVAARWRERFFEGDAAAVEEAPHRALRRALPDRRGLRARRPAAPGSGGAPRGGGHPAGACRGARDVGGDRGAVARAGRTPRRAAGRRRAESGTCWGTRRRRGRATWCSRTDAMPARSSPSSTTVSCRSARRSPRKRGAGSWASSSTARTRARRRPATAALRSRVSPSAPEARSVPRLFYLDRDGISALCCERGPHDPDADHLFARLFYLDRLDTDIRSSASAARARRRRSSPRSAWRCRAASSSAGVPATASRRRSPSSWERTPGPTRCAGRGNWTCCRASFEQARHAPDEHRRGPGLRARPARPGAALRQRGFRRRRTGRLCLTGGPAGDPGQVLRLWVAFVVQTLRYL